uniref:Uncharacterized protein n=1 Tax=Salix viminalis TaxID=40686 RepID=A0A6N2LEB1_SALVM
MVLLVQHGSTIFQSQWIHHCCPKRMDIETIVMHTDSLHNFSTVPKSVLQLLGSSYIMRSTAWEMYGSAPLARINSLVYTTCFADASSSSDAASVHAKLIQHLAVFRGYKEVLTVSKSVILLVKLQLLHEQEI